MLVVSHDRYFLTTVATDIVHMHSHRLDSYRGDYEVSTLATVGLILYGVIHRTYIHTYMHTFIHTYIHTYCMHTACIHTCIHSYIHTFIHTYIHVHLYSFREELLILAHHFEHGSKYGIIIGFKASKNTYIYLMFANLGYVKIFQPEL